MTRTVSLLILLTLGIGPMTSSISAQPDRLVVFAHGINANGSVWSSSAAALESMLRIKARTPTLGSFDYFGVQASRLADTSDISAILAGHSNGGIVSRLVGRSRTQHGVLTFGTANSGFPLHDTYPHFLWYTAFTLMDIAYAGAQFCGGLFLDNRCSWWLTIAWLGTYDIGALLQVWPQPLLRTFVGASDPPIWSQMSPQSSFMTRTLNTPAALDSEATRIVTRIGATWTTDNYYFGGFWRPITSPASADRIGLAFQVVAYDLMYWGVRLLWDAGDNYGSQYQVVEEALALWAIAFDFAGFDEEWCRDVNGGDACGPSDERVPLWSQTWGAEVDYHGPGTHNDETRQTDTLRDALQIGFGVAGR